MPSPLQSFCPAQAFLALLQSLNPLQALTPSHATFAVVALLPAVPLSLALLLLAQPTVRNSAAALAAIAIPERFLLLVMLPPPVDSDADESRPDWIAIR